MYQFDLLIKEIEEKNKIEGRLYIYINIYMHRNYLLRRRDKRLQDVLSFKDLRKVDQKSSPFSKGMRDQLEITTYLNKQRQESMQM